MSHTTAQAPQIVPRERMDFKLDSTIPKYWFRQDAFKTRAMDGMQVSFPDGERFFISCVRAFKEQITDPELAQHVKDFTRQEAQHGMVHTKYNAMLAEQGMPIAEMLTFQKARMARYHRRFSPRFNLALTAAFEHFTALLAETFFGRAAVMEGADARMKAVFAWHAIEEMEHKAVVFDVMTKVAKIGYAMRCAAMLYGTWETMVLMFKYSDMLLQADGFSWFQRKAMIVRNLGWMLGTRGVLTGLLPQIVAYFKPGFHPNDIPNMHNYQNWVDAYQHTNDPVRACDALVAAAR